MTDVLSVVAPDAPVLDVVFLHGLNGDARTTWEADEAFWPDWLGEDIAGAAVWSVGYAASPSGWLGKAMPIQDRAVNVLARLQNEGIGERPLVFVTHSMGGLLAKQMLLHAQGSPSFESFAAAIRGVVFLATPHTGAKMATFLTRLKHALRATAATKDLVRNGAHLRDLNVKYRDWVQKAGIQNLVFFEARKTRGAQIVDADSADPGLVGAGPIAVDSDHFAICKPADRGALVYGQVRRFVTGIRDVPPHNDPGSASLDSHPPPTAQEHTDGLGRLIDDWDPVELEVHSAPPVPLGNARSPARLPGYVRRPHDELLADRVAAAARGESQMAVLVGSSSTGKTRACWEAIQPLTNDGWRLWHPFDPNRAEAVLENIDQVGPKTVLWLNDSQHYFSARSALGERVAAALSTLLTDPQRRPVLVLATLWGKHVDAYMATSHDFDDPHAQVRALIAERRIPVPDRFDDAALDQARALAEAGDEQLTASLLRAPDGRVPQDLAGAPELVHRYHAAAPAARAVLQAAMDARRLGIGLRLPIGFLRRAAEGYLSDHEHDALHDDWFEQALNDLAVPVHGTIAPLRRIRSRHSTSLPAAEHRSPEPDLSERGYRLADYLEEYGDHDRIAACPPSSFWAAAHDHITDSDELVELAKAALRRYRLSWAFHLQQRSGTCAPSGRDVRSHVMRMREAAGDRSEVDALVLEQADAGNAWALLWLAAQDEEEGNLERADDLLRKAAETGHVGAIARLLTLREAASDVVESSALRDRLITATGARPDLLPRMYLKKGDVQCFGRSSSLSPRAGYLWVQPYGPTGWIFTSDGKPVPYEYCAIIDGMPIIAAIHYQHSDVDLAVEHLVSSGGTALLSLFISRQSISDYKAEGYRQLEELARRSEQGNEVEVVARRIADSGAFLESFFADELDREMNWENNCWIIDHVTRWWPHGLDPDGKPSSPW